jgi:hypothetical protein
MMERFNFYDVYGYLIPGTVWLVLLALPFWLTLSTFPASFATLTALGLLGGYIAGHVLAGLARVAIPSARYQIGGESVQRSVAVLSADYPGKDPLAKAVRQNLGRCFQKRFEFNPIDPFDLPGAKQMFFLCRTALAQAKLVSYVEQYQGMSNLTRSLAFASVQTATFYSAWVVAGILWRLPEANARNVLPMVTLVAGMFSAMALRRAVKREAIAEKRELAPFKLARAECFAALILSAIVAAAAARWYPLDARMGHQLAIAATLLWMLASRMQSASESFDEFMVVAVYRDFVVSCLSPKSEPDPDPETQ